MIAVEWIGMGLGILAGIGMLAVLGVLLPAPALTQRGVLLADGTMAGMEKPSKLSRALIVIAGIALLLTAYATAYFFVAEPNHRHEWARA